MMRQARSTSKTPSYFLTVIEWDGLIPPRKWYRRLHRMIGGVRGDKGKSVVERRAEKGIIAQEGAILCSSRSLARALGQMAYEFGAAQVWISPAPCALENEFGFSKEDREILTRVEARLSRRGRKEDPESWVVTCRECLETFAHHSERPLQCPKCKGLAVQVRRGTIRTFTDDPAVDILKAWKNTRFYHRNFEFTQVKASGGDKVVSDEDDVLLTEPRELAALSLLNGANGFLSLVRAMPREHAFELLDAIFVARGYMTQKDRAHARLESITTYIRLGGELSGFSLAEIATEPDLFDAAAVIGSTGACRYALQYADMVRALKGVTK